jgi:hypothetical protein
MVKNIVGGKKGKMMANKNGNGNGQVYFLIWHPCPITA